MKVIQIATAKSNYIIPFLLFAGSFLIYSYNLNQQPWHGDEINYLGWAANYIHLIKSGDIGNPCLISINNCNILYHIPAHALTYSPLRMILIGFPIGIQNLDYGSFYNWSCYWFSCYNPQKAPTIDQMASGRLLSPFFGSLTITISFLIGKILLNRFVGIISSILFLFYDLWLWYSRTVMTEVHYIFFAMLSLLLLLYTFKSGQFKIKYLIFSAVAFGLALTSKILSVEFSVLFLGIILFGGLQKVQSLTNKPIRNGSKIVLSIILFFTVSLFSFFLTEPGFYQNPLKEIFVIKKDMDNYNRDVWFIGYPTVNGISTNRIALLFHYTLFPSILEQKIPGAFPNSTMKTGWYNPPTYSSIALTIFFFIGFGYLIDKVRSLRKFRSEGILLIWFLSMFIFTLLIARDLSLERYLLPLLISIIFISSYGFWRLTKDLRNYRLKFVFASYFIFAHSITSLFYWQKLYFSPGTFWFNPLRYGTLQESFDNTSTLVVNIIFVGFFLFMLLIPFRKRIKPESNGDVNKNTFNRSFGY